MLLLGLSNVWLLIALLFLLYALGLGFVPSKLSGHLFCRQGKAQNCWALSNVFCFCWYMNYFFPFSDWGVCVTRFYTRLVCFGFILFNSLFVHMKWLAEFVFTFHLFRVPRLIYEGSVSSGSWWCDIWLIIFFPQSSYFRFSLEVVWSSAFAIWLESYKWANYCFTNAMDLQIFPCCYLLCLHCAVIGFSKWLLLFKFWVTRSSWFLLVCSCLSLFL